MVTSSIDYIYELSYKLNIKNTPDSGTKCLNSKYSLKLNL